MLTGPKGKEVIFVNLFSVLVVFIPSIIQLILTLPPVVASRSDTYNLTLDKTTRNRKFTLPQKFHFFDGKNLKVYVCSSKRPAFVCLHTNGCSRSNPAAPISEIVVCFQNHLSGYKTL